MMRSFWESEFVKLASDNAGPFIEHCYTCPRNNKANNSQISRAVEEASKLYVLDLPMRGATRRCAFSASNSQMHTRSKRLFRLYDGISIKCDRQRRMARDSMPRFHVQPSFNRGRCSSFCFSRGVFEVRIILRSLKTNSLIGKDTKSWSL